MTTLDVSLLRSLRLFEGLSKDDLSELLKLGKCKRFEKGALVFEQSEKAISFFLLLDGYIRVVKITPEGEQVIVRYISSGQLFGIAQALERDTYPANAIAAKDCVALVWPNNTWKKITSRWPSFTSGIYKAVGERLQDAQEQIVGLATERVEQRVANALLKLSRQTGVRVDEGILIDFAISRKDISEMTGTTLHTVSRLMSAWEAKGIVQSGRQKIIITNGDQLAQIADGAAK